MVSYARQGCLATIAFAAALLVESSAAAADRPGHWPSVLQAAFDADAATARGRITGSHTVVDSTTGRGDPSRKLGEVVRVKAKDGTVIMAYREPVTGMVYKSIVGPPPAPGSRTSFHDDEVADAVPCWERPPDAFEMQFDNSLAGGPRWLLVFRAPAITTRSLTLPDRRVEWKELDAAHAKEVGSFVDKTFGKLPSSPGGEATVPQITVREPAYQAWAQRALAADLTGALVEHYRHAKLAVVPSQDDGNQRLVTVQAAHKIANHKGGEFAISITLDAALGNRIVAIRSTLGKPGLMVGQFEVTVEYRPGPSPGTFE